MENPISIDLSTRYRRFAEVEARGRSPLYEALANGVAADPEAIGFLLTLPKEKQQPNLLLTMAASKASIPNWRITRMTSLSSWSWLI